MKKVVLFLLTLCLIVPLVSCNKGLSVDDFDKTVTIDETVIYNKNHITITAEKLKYNNYNVSLLVNFKNSGEEDFNVLCGAVGYSVNSVNGYMISDGYLSCDLKAGESITKEIDFGYENLLTFGITQIADLEIGFSLKGEESGYVYTGPLTVKTSANSSYDYSENNYQECMQNGDLENMLGCSLDYFSKENIYENSHVRVLSIAIIRSEANVLLCVEVENLTNEHVKVGIKDMNVNGILISPSATYGEDINPHKKHIVSVSFSSLLRNYEKDFSKIKIMEEIEFLFGSTNGSWYDVVDLEKIIVVVDKIELPNKIIE